MTDEARTDLLRGTLQLLILKALALEPLHGVAISRWTGARRPRP
jgi:DNA-binding PadR family transcriptional regulator